MGSETTSPRIEGNVFIARDGVRLPLSVWGPRKDPEKIVIAAHSFGEFRDSFALIGDHLAQQNIAVWAYDQRGFGDAPHRGLWAGKDALISDFQDFIRAVSTEAEKSAPMILVGESMGAAVVIATTVRDAALNPEAIILSGPGVRKARPFRYWFNVGLWLATRVAASYAVEVPRTYDSRYADYHARRWAEDSRIIDKVRLDTYFGLIRLSDLASDLASEIRTPTLVLFGTNDSQIHPRSLCALRDDLGENGTFKIFDEGPHLMFQVREQAEILNLITSWIEAPDGLSPNGDTGFCQP